MTAPIVLITGATRGIGFAAAKQLAARGAKVIIASRDLSRAETAAGKIGGITEAIQLDITDETSLRNAAELIQQRHGRLDVLANNSGVLLDGSEPLTRLPPQTLRDTLETNLIGTFRVTLVLLPLLERAAAPRIINVSGLLNRY
jgi:NAD(P)-dependent dehydrogenase (short-subunit alcohol dehydrogenase family)